MGTVHPGMETVHPGMGTVHPGMGTAHPEAHRTRGPDIHMLIRRIGGGGGGGGECEDIVMLEIASVLRCKYLLLHPF